MRTRDDFDSGIPLSEDDRDDRTLSRRERRAGFPLPTENGDNRTPGRRERLQNMQMTVRRTGLPLSAEDGDGRALSRRERLENASMTVHRMETGTNCTCGVTSRQFERFLNYLGASAEEEDDTTCEELAAQTVTTAPLGRTVFPSEAASLREPASTNWAASIEGVGTGKLTGAANPAAAIVPPCWRCPMSGEMCPFAAAAQSGQLG